MSNDRVFAINDGRVVTTFVEADMSKFLAAIIDSLNHDISISSVQDPTEKIKKLKYHDSGNQ